MTPRADLHVEVRADEIIVTLPHTSYRVVYHKQNGEPGLIAKSRSGRWEQGVTMTIVEFHARAWKAASDKARKLEWIV
jgi:hypothetical protein